MTPIAALPVFRASRPPSYWIAFGANKASPASTKLLGLTPEQLVGRPVREQIEPEDFPTVRQEIKRLHLGEVDSAHFSYRVRRPDGTIVWLESAVRKAYHPLTGAADGMVAITRDVTSRKLHEVELNALARTDGLTGLANRRMLDEMLEREYARAKRDGTSLALVLIDLDHFKLFNDTYGHQAGDECLKVLAQILKDHVRRPGDIAARYGGEKFALLLPNTFVEGALLVAAKIQADLEMRAIPHSGNLPSTVVTLSAGAVAVAIFAGSPSPANMIARADAELYRAKASGRNRVSASRPLEILGLTG